MRVCNLLVLFLVLSCHPLHAQVISGPIFNPANGHYYYLLDASNWTSAQVQASSLNGNLVTINDAAEQSWVYSTFGTFGGVDRSLWIGFNDVDTEGVFTWVSGESSNYSNWINGEPNNNGNEDYVHMIRAGNQFGHSPGTWNDAPDTTSLLGFEPFNGVVEAIAVPEPGPLTLASCCLCGAVCYVWVKRMKARTLWGN